MVNFTKLEEEVVSKAEEAVRTVVKEAAANEPTIGQAVSTALEGAGVPPTLVGVAVGLVESLLAHFTPQAAANVTITSSTPSVSVSQPAPVASPESAQSSEPAAPEAASAAPPFPEANPA